MFQGLGLFQVLHLFQCPEYIGGNFTTTLTLIIMYVPISFPFAVHYVLIFAQHSRDIHIECSKQFK